MKYSSSMKSSNRHDKEREHEEAKRLFTGVKLNKTFQIPKLMKSDETSPNLPSLGMSGKPMSGYGPGSGTVSYTHLTLPTNREV